MKRIEIDFRLIKNWDSFHNEFAKKLRFPSYYGNNMNAWVDCMDELIQENTVIDLGDCSAVDSQFVDAVLRASAFVNYRRIEANESPYILISMTK